MRTACAALAVLLAAGLPSAGLTCDAVREDVLVPSDPAGAMIRPRECSSVEQNPPDFSWPYFGSGPYTVKLTFPDGHIESRTAENNWLNWNAALPEGDYSWVVRRAGDASEPRRFTVGADAVPFVVPDMSAVIDHLLAKARPRGLPEGATLASMKSQRPDALVELRWFVDHGLDESLPAQGNAGDGYFYDRYGMRALRSLMAYAYDGTDAYREDAKRRVLNLA
ncbi:MAG: hypothetical protein ACREQZ_15220, partial [Woeseiaceae bacterium]